MEAQLPIGDVACCPATMTLSNRKVTLTNMYVIKLTIIHCPTHTCRLGHGCSIKANLQVPIVVDKLSQYMEHLKRSFGILRSAK